jgi:hypothetical protein
MWTRLVYLHGEPFSVDGIQASRASCDNKCSGARRLCGAVLNQSGSPRNALCRLTSEAENSALYQGRIACKSAIVVIELENGDRPHQVASLGPQTAGRGCHLFNQRGVLLCRVVHLGDGLANLCDTGSLLIAGRTYCAHNVRDSPDAGDYFRHGLTRFGNLYRALLNPLYTGADKTFDLFGGVSTAACE